MSEFTEPQLETAEETPVAELDRGDNRHYLNHWTELVAQHKSLRNNPSFRKSAEQTQRRACSLDASLPELLDQQGRLTLTEVTEWYRRLGSTSDIRGASERLGIAGILIERDLPKVEWGAEPFLLAGDLAFDQLLLIGKDVDAESSKKARQLARQAQEFYVGVIEPQRPDRYDSDAQRALRSMFDVDFELLRQEVSVLPLRERNGKNLQFFRARYRDLLKKEADQVIDSINTFLTDYEDLEARAKDLSRRGKVQEANQIGLLMCGNLGRVSGDLFEWFAPVMYRYVLMRERQEWTASIRGSLIREQDPKFDAKALNRKELGKLPKQSVDIVIDRYVSGYHEETDRYQLKLGDWSDKVPYLPGISVFDDFRAAANDIFDSVKARGVNGSSSDLQLVYGIRKVFEFMQAGLDAQAHEEKEDPRERELLERFASTIGNQLLVAV